MGTPITLFEAVYNIVFYGDWMQRSLLLVVFLILARCVSKGHCFGMSCCLPKTPTFSPHLEDRTIKNPFPGINALEAAIGRKIVDRIGSNEGIPVQDHPLAGLPMKTIS
jgi:hypothetical protein